MNTPLLAVLPYCSKDIELAKNLLKWIGELGGCPGHSCLLIADSVVPKEERAAVKALAIPSFANVDTIPVSIPERGFAPNHMFMLAAQQVMFSYKLPWLWLEPDCVPLKSGWLSVLSAEYAGSPKRLLGNLIEATQPGLPAVHLSGVSIYPPDVFPLYDAFASIKSANVAWDMEAASAAVPRAKNSQFMQHLWGQRDLPPTFVKEAAAGLPVNAKALDFIQPDAVLFHRCKDSSLISLLRERSMFTPLNRYVIEKDAVRIAPAPPTSIPNPDYITPKRRGRPPKVNPAPTPA
jgi:hypothetical protein